ncbi:hypothetical protein [Methylobacterium sp. WL19]|uniref:hypothetical protein n=1 Tax=Methylobacterium sp. WL19 TaxID=2603896 RepID=UPI0011C73465|nr:hypothetical protein [Methylobacterium sp. WL19]TXN33888.1 hypothetical protein FV220_00095 [Methylobacterium sp. WL19]
MNPTAVIDNADWLLAVLIQPVSGQTVDFSGTALFLALTPTFGGDPIAIASSEDGSLTFVPGATPYFAIDLRVADRTWRVSRVTSVLGDILRYPDPANPDHVEWLGRLALRVHPGSSSSGIVSEATSPVLIPAQPFEGRLVAAPVIVGPQGVPGLAGNGSSLVHEQGSAASTWIIPHNFGRRPSVSVYSASGDEMLTDVTATTTSVSVVFAQPTAGSAILA